MNGKKDTDAFGMCIRCIDRGSERRLLLGYTPHEDIRDMREVSILVSDASQQANVARKAQTCLAAT